MDLQILKIIQLMRNPVTDWFFYIVTQIGDQYFFIALAVIIYWTINKKYAHKFVFTFMISALFNTILKEIFKRPRPYTQPGVYTDPMWMTTGYSFPSGHSQAAGVMGYTAFDASKKTNKKWIWYVGIALMILIPLSRVYLGQHYPSDVLVGLILAFVIAHFVFKLVDAMGDNEHIYTIMLAPIFILFLFFTTNSIVYVAAGGFVGFAVGYYLEKVYVKYDVNTTFLKQVLKVVLGLVVALLIKEGMKFVFPYSATVDIHSTTWDLIFDFIRYLMIGAWAAVGAPLVFKYVFRNR